MTRADLSAIEAVAGLDGVNLPENFVRRALSVYQGRVDDARFVPLITSSSGETGPNIAALSLTDVDKLKSRFGADEVSWLGAFTTADASTPAPNTQAASTSQTGVAKAVGIIDVGFAFWNDRFVVNDSSVFDDIGFLSSSGDQDIWLTGSGIQDLLDGSDPTYRNQSIRTSLARRFPQSIYAATERGLSVYTPSGFNHGTAMADLALPTEPLPTFALELPAEALLDSSGDLLEANLIPALRTLRNRMLADPRVTSDTELVVLLAFGYPGGPHDASRPIIQALTNELAGTNMRLVIPTGNHLQERCHARWELTGNQATAPLAWVFDVEDYSANHVAMHYDDARPVVILSDPLGTTVSWAQGDERLVKLIAQVEGDDVVIGLALDTPHAGGGGRIDLILTSTAGDGFNCRAGRWALQFAGGSQQVEAWISRDDMSIPNAAARRRKQSWFEDDAYQINGGFGRPAQTDLVLSRIKRAGTASALSTFANGEDKAVVVGAGQETFKGVINANYSGLPHDGALPDLEVVHREIGSQGVLALGNGSVSLFRVSGSSAAAALRTSALLRA